LIEKSNFVLKYQFRIEKKEPLNYDNTSSDIKRLAGKRHIQIIEL